VNQRADIKRLVLHIGGAKCGSSAVQQYLAFNSRALGKDGVLIPAPSLEAKYPVHGQQIWFFEELSNREGAGDLLSSRFSELHREMVSNNWHTVIVSAENISLHPNLADIVRTSTTNFDVKIILYVRRQDDFLISAWQQWGLKFSASLEEYAATSVDALADWAAMIAPWEHAFGSENIIVRPFRRDLLHEGDVVADFFDVLGLSREGLVSLKSVSNPSYSEHLGDIAFRINSVFSSMHDSDFFFCMERLIGNETHKKNSASHLMNLEERLDFLRKYEEGNRQIKEKYLPNMGDHPLFDPPSHESVAQLSEIEKLKAENAFLARAVYALARKVEAIEAQGSANQAGTSPPAAGDNP